MMTITTSSSCRGVSDVHNYSRRRLRQLISLVSLLALVLVVAQQHTLGAPIFPDVTKITVYEDDFSTATSGDVFVNTNFGTVNNFLRNQVSSPPATYQSGYGRDDIMPNYYNMKAGEVCFGSPPQCLDSTINSYHGVFYVHSGLYEFGDYSFEMEWWDSTTFTFNYCDSDMIGIAARYTDNDAFYDFTWIRTEALAPNGVSSCDSVTKTNRLLRTRHNSTAFETLTRDYDVPFDRSSTKYRTKITVHSDLISIFLAQGSDPYTLWSNVTDDSFQTGTIGIMHNDGLTNAINYDNMKVEVSAETLPDISLLSPAHAGVLRLGRNYQEFRNYNGIDQMVNIGTRKYYVFQLQTGTYTDQLLTFRANVTSSACCINMYVQYGASGPVVPTTSSYLKRSVSTRVAAASIALVSPAAGFYVVHFDMTEEGSPVYPDYVIEWRNELVTPTNIDLGTANQVVGAQVPRGGYTTYKLSSSVPYTGFSFLMTPDVPSSVPYFRTYLRRDTPATDTAGEYDSVTASPALDGTYTASVFTGNLEPPFVYFLTVFVPTDPEPSSDPVTESPDQVRTFTMRARTAAPQIFNLQPQSGPTSGSGTTLELTGQNIGDANAPELSLIFFNGMACSPVTVSVDHSTVRCPLPPGQGTSIGVFVTHIDQSASSAQNFSYDRPTFVPGTPSPSSGRTIGEEVIVISGQNFGTADRKVFFDDAECVLTDTVLASPHTTIECTTPAGPGSVSPIKAVNVIIGGQSSDQSLPSFTYSKPSVIDVQPRLYSTIGGDIMRIYGDNFGDSGATVRLDSVSGPTLDCSGLPYNHTYMECRMQAGAGTGREIFVIVATAASSNNPTVSYVVPTVSQYAPKASRTAGGLLLTIKGENFGPGVATVRVAGVPAACGIGSGFPGTYVNQTYIVCSFPSGQAAQVTVQVEAGFQSSEGFTMAYLPPIIDSVTPSNGVSKGGQPLILRGDNFGVSGIVKIGDNVCNEKVWHNHTVIQCSTPAGNGRNQSVTLDIDGVVSPRKEFDYDAPVVTNVSPGNGPTPEGSTSIEITGRNFGITGSVTIDGNPCLVANPQDDYDHERILCNTPAGDGLNQSLVVRTAQQINLWRGFDYDAPVISELDPLLFPTGGDDVENLVITGENFGRPSAAVTVTVIFSDLSEVSCPVTGVHSHTSIECVFPARPAGKIGTGIRVRVTIEGQSATSDAEIGYERPTIDQFLPPTAVSYNPVAPVILTLNGRSFDIDGTVTVGTDTCDVGSAGTLYSHNQIKCRFPESQGLSVPIVITTVDGKRNQVPVLYNFDRPSLSDVSPDDINTQGDEYLTLVGTSFGVNGTVTVGGRSCTNATWSHVLIKCKAPAGQGTQKDVVVISANQRSDDGGATRIDYNVPTLNVPSPANGPTLGGNNITLTGTNFGSEGSITVEFGSGGRRCEPVYKQDHGEIVCTAPYGQGSVNLFVTVSDQVSTEDITYVYDDAEIDKVSPGVGPTLGQETIVVTGSNFGRSGATVLVGTKGCPVIANGQNDTHILCTLPIGQGQGLSVSVQVSTLPVATKTTAFSYLSPRVSNIDPSNGPTSGSTSILITGSNFGTSGTVQFAGIGACANAVFNHGTITCSTPIGSGFNRSVTVDVSSQISNRGRFDYDSPVIRQVSYIPIGLPPTGGSVTLSIEGDNFGVDRETVQVSVGGVDCPILQAGDITDSSIRCNLPGGEGTDVPLYVTVDGQISERGSVTYDAPEISSQSTSTSPTLGTGILQLIGKNFGTIRETRIGGRLCQDIVGAFDRNTRIDCSIPPGEGAGQIIRVNVTENGWQVTQSQIAVINYVGPSVSETGVNPSSAGTNSLAEVVISGDNFGSAVANVTATIGGYACGNIRERTHSSFKCDVPVGYGKDKQVSVFVEDRSSTPVPAFSYTAPTITNITTDSGLCNVLGQNVEECAKAGNVPLTILGSNFGPVDAALTITVRSSQTGIEYACLNGTHNATTPHSVIYCTLQNGTGFANPLSVQVGEQSSNELLVSYAGPVVYSNTLRFSGSPSYAGGADQTSSVRNVTLVATTVAGGDLVFLEGRTLRVSLDPSDAPTIKYGVSGGPYEYTCEHISSTLDEITCRLSAGIGRNLRFIVSDGESTSFETLDRLDYPQPALVNTTLALVGRPPEVIGGLYSSASATVTESEQLVLNASNVGTDASRIKVYYGPATQPLLYQCSLRESKCRFEAEVAELYCDSEAGEGGPFNFTVVAGNYFSSQGKDIFFYPTTPEILEVRGCSGSEGDGTQSCPTAGGISITVKAKSINADTNIRIGSDLCEDPEFTSLANDIGTIQCTLPAGTGKNVPVVATKGLVFSRAATLVSYVGPTVDTIIGTPACTAVDSSSVKLCPNGGSTQITLRGTDFGPSNARVVIGGQFCADVIHAVGSENEEVQCTLGPGFQQNLPVYLLQSAGEISDPPLQLSYTPCPVGTFADASRDFNCTACAPGTANGVEASFACSNCEPGRYANSSGSVSCLPCDAGTAGDERTYCPVCTKGKFSASKAQIVCDNCPTGRYGPGLNATRCYDCNNGTASDSAGQPECDICTKGTYSPENDIAVVTCLSCPTGFRSVNDGANDCTKCAPGFVQPKPGQSDCARCQRGQAQSGSGQATCDECESGFFSNTTGLTVCFSCPIGQVSSKAAPGDPGPQACADCEPGEYMPASGQANCLLCDRGRYQPAYGKGDCIDCPLGKFTGDQQSVECTNCTAGFYAPVEGTVSCLRCEPGRYTNKSGLAVCTDCEPGRYQESSESTLCLPCAPGTASIERGRLATCSVCPAGFAASGFGNTGCTECDIGEESSDDRTQCVQCGPGYYAPSSKSPQCLKCPTGTAANGFGTQACKACPIGKFADIEGLIECKNCTRGTASASIGTAQECPSCSAGKYNNGTGAVECINCPEGRFTGDNGVKECTKCAIGDYASVPGQLTCKGCPPGQFSNGTGQIDCFACPSGRFKSGIGAGSCIKCLEGYSQPAIGQASCIPCSAGSFTNVTGLSECISCPPGKYSENPDVEAGDLNFKCLDCPPGQFAASFGTEFRCTACPVNQIQITPGSTGCSKCPRGTDRALTPANSAAIACNACGFGSVNAEAGGSCSICGPGTFSKVQNGTECISCERGSATDGIGQKECDLCIAGKHAAEEKQTACDPCAQGKYADVDGLTDCKLCDKGEEQPAPGATECTKCDEGRFSISDGTIRCEQCALGRYANTTGFIECPLCEIGQESAEDRIECVDCAPGEYNDIKGGECRVCAPGTFSEGKAEFCTPCAQGTAQGDSGKSFCAKCPLGRYAPGTNSRSCEKCSPGSFANSSGLAQCYPCGPGSEAPSDTAFSCTQCKQGYFSAGVGQARCTACPAGRHQNLTGQIDCIDCEVGYSNLAPAQPLCTPCDKGSAVSSPGQLFCPSCVAGRFANTTGLASCYPCTAGQDSRNQAGEENCQDCLTGKFMNVPGQPLCLSCAPGSYAGNEKEVACTLCEAGKFAEGSESVKCEECDVGTFSGGTGASRCTDCERGSFSDVLGNSTCQLCAPGKFANIAGSTECTPCERGTFSGGFGAVECQPCPRGSNMNITGASVCDLCAAGKVAGSTGAFLCENCTTGYYSGGKGESVCQPCGRGSFMNLTGQSQCDLCLPGRFAGGVGLTECEPCGPGRYTSSQGSASCPGCARGTFASGNGTITCPQCPVGRYAFIETLSECAACEPGRFAASIGSSKCEDCPEGQYQTEFGNTTCNLCPSLTVQPSKGRATCDVCDAGFHTARQLGQLSCVKCAPGTFRASNSSGECSACDTGKFRGANDDSKSCQLCDIGKFQSGTGSAFCETCSPNAVANRLGSVICDPCGPRAVTVADDRTECVCQAGTYYCNKESLFCQQINEAENCVACPTGAECDDPGVQFQTLRSERGFWRCTDESDVFHRCLIKSHCDGGVVVVPNSEGLLNCTSCSGQRVGAICAVCRDGYHSPTTTGDCVECPDYETSLIYTFLFSILVVGVLVLMYYVVLRTDRHLIRDAKIRTERKKQNEWEFFEDEEEATQTTKNLYDKAEVEHGLAPRAKPNFVYKLKIILGFFQISTNLAFALDIPWPTYYQSFISVFGLVNFDFIQWSNAGCAVNVDFYDKYLAVTLTPIAVMMLVSLFYLLPRYIKQLHQNEDYDLRRAAQARERKKFWKLFMFTVFLIYPAVSATTLRLFVCRDIVIGTDVEQNQAGDTVVSENRVSFLLSDFDVECRTERWWNYVKIDVFFILLYPLGIPCFFLGMLYFNRNRLNLPDVRVQLGFLYEAYTNDLWWFELIDMLNKLVLTSLLGFFPPDYQTLQLAFALVFSATYLVTILLLKPYIRKGDDRLHLFAQNLIFIVLLAGWTFVKFDSEGDLDEATDITYSVVLILAMAFLFMFFIGQIVVIAKKMWDRYRAEKELKAQLERDDANVDTTHDIRGLRLPKDAMMMRNPLFDGGERPENLAEQDSDGSGIGNDSYSGSDNGSEYSYSGSSASVSPRDNEGPAPVTAPSEIELAVAVDDPNSDDGMGSGQDSDSDDDNVTTFAARQQRRR
jgi:IPT/TIG domain/Transient receptor potential (TRP) ion channel/Tyrosine-protein kinase ephrin type A/B receptor-like